MSGEDFDNLPVRELLRLSQTDVTLDPEVGYGFAVTAYNKALAPEVRAVDPDAVVSAASKAALRAAQAEHPLGAIKGWMDSARSLTYTDQYIPTSREKVDMHLTVGRTLGFLAIKEPLPDLLKEQPRVDFQAAEETVQHLHKWGQRWDRYATMLSRHSATYEASRGSAVFAATTAMRGAWRAIRAEREDRPPEEHKKFVNKQLKANLAALALSASKPLNYLPSIKRRRQQLALRLIG